MTLYRGRIDTSYDALMDAINRSLPVDIRLLPFDLAVNRAWAGELLRLGVFSDAEHAAVVTALGALAAESFDPLPADEDVHSLVERRLTEIAGDAGARIHTGRSRNDQVATDTRLAARAALDDLDGDLAALCATIADLAEAHVETLMPGTTHLQPAQPISLAHFLLSAGFALARDRDRLRDARRRANRCPLGSGALAGSGFPVDRARLAAALGFDAPLENALDATADRDFVQEIVAACAIALTHLSRYAEQFVIWANPNFGYVRFADAWSTGSSMMPQKRNPDPMELIRAKAARVIGDAAAALALTKGVPLAYAKDLQEDKRLLFDALDTARLCVAVFGHALASAAFNTARLRTALTGDLLATDLADALARRGVPFRTCHHRVAQFVSELEAAGRSLTDATPAELAARFPELNDADYRPDFAAALARRDVIGGTAPARVREQIAALRTLLGN